MANYRNLMPSLDPFYRTLERLTDFTLPTSQLRNISTRAKREARTVTNPEWTRLKGIQRLLEQQRAASLGSIQGQWSLLPQMFRQNLLQGTRAVSEQERQRGALDSGLALQNILGAGTQALGGYSESLGQLAQQMAGVEGQYHQNLLSQVFSPQRQLAEAQGSEAAQRYRQYINQAQQEMFQGRLNKAERLLNQAQLEYNALIAQAQERMLQEQASYDQRLMREQARYAGSSYKGGGKLDDWLKEAIRITGVPMSWLPHLRTIAMKESSGNPRAVNRWDINAKRGTPSKGLMQTIEPTFNRYKMKGMGDIFNPVHNAVAAIRYIIARYGTVTNVPGIKSMMRGGKYRGY